MDFQVLFNVAICVAGFFGGWTLNRIYSAIDRLDGDVRNMPLTYVSKDDFKDALKDLKENMHDGFSKIDSNIGTLFKRLDRKEDKQ
jgi:hypothetical protein